jgi:hypothetical protein
MEKKTKKILLVSSALLLIGGGIYLMTRKKEEEKNSQDNTSSGGSTSNSPEANVDIQKPASIISFQKFANSKGWSPKLKEDNIFGPKTEAAWKSLANDYNKSIGLTVEPFKKGQKVIPKFPLSVGVAYDRKTGKAIGKINSAIFEGYTSSPDKWFLAIASIMKPGALIPSSVSVQLLTKEWQ